MPWLKFPSHNFDPFFRQAVKARELFTLHTLEYSAHSGRYKRLAQFYKYAFEVVRSDVALRILFHILALWVAIFR